MHFPISRDYFFPHKNHPGLSGRDCKRRNERRQVLSDYFPNFLEASCLAATASSKDFCAASTLVLAVLRLSIVLLKSAIFAVVLAAISSRNLSWPPSGYFLASAAADSLIS